MIPNLQYLQGLWRSIKFKIEAVCFLLSEDIWTFQSS